MGGDLPRRSRLAGSPRNAGGRPAGGLGGGRRAALRRPTAERPLRAPPPSSFLVCAGALSPRRVRDGCRRRPPALLSDEKKCGLMNGGGWLGLGGDRSSRLSAFAARIAGGPSSSPLRSQAPGRFRALPSLSSPRLVSGPWGDARRPAGRASRTWTCSWKLFWMWPFFPFFRLRQLRGRRQTRRRRRKFRLLGGSATFGFSPRRTSGGTSSLRRLNLGNDLDRCVDLGLHGFDQAAGQSTIGLITGKRSVVSQDPMEDKSGYMYTGLITSKQGRKDGYTG